MDWKGFWNDFARRYPEQDFCFQVGRFSRGRGTDEAELTLTVAQVHDGLSLCRRDRVLDLCCGNGLLTARYADLVESTVGVDFSQELLRIARRYHCPPGVSYVLAAVEDLSPGLFPDGGGFDKVSMFESLQYFRPETFGVLLERIADIVSPEHRLYFSGVLDLARIDRFLDTPERRRRFEEQAAQGQHEMGHWWTREAIARVAHQRGYHVEFRDQHPRLNTAHYRFDLLLVAS